MEDELASASHHIFTTKTERTDKLFEPDWLERKKKFRNFGQSTVNWNYKVLYKARTQAKHDANRTLLSQREGFSNGALMERYMSAKYHILRVNVPQPVIDAAIERGLIRKAASGRILDARPVVIWALKRRKGPI